MKVKALLTLFILVCSWQISAGQKTNKNVTITGIVTDSEKQPVQGAIIFIDDVKTNSITNIKGHYKVIVPLKAQKMSVLSFLSGASEELINGRISIDFILTSKSSQPKINGKKGDIETVSDGYSTIKKEDSPAPGSKIDGQKLRFKSYQNIFEMIRGEVTGVRVSGNRIQIMGPSSFNANDEPLFIVDGVIVDKIDDVIPGQVKSIEILTGASASIYGTRGAYGVIVIKLISGTEK